MYLKTRAGAALCVDHGGAHLRAYKQPVMLLMLGCWVFVTLLAERAPVHGAYTPPFGLLSRLGIRHHRLPKSVPTGRTAARCGSADVHKYPSISIEVLSPLAPHRSPACEPQQAARECVERRRSLGRRGARQVRTGVGLWRAWQAQEGVNKYATCCATLHSANTARTAGS